MIKKRIYLDYAASTPLAPEVAKAMEKSLCDFGNPSSLHAEGRAARAHREKARETVAGGIGAQSEEIFFTSGGTEANFLALLGIAEGASQKGKHIVTSAIEHSSVLGTTKLLEKRG